MHIRKNGQRHLWLLSGTGEGPLLAAALVSHGWNVTVSVVSSQAALQYLDMPLEDVWVGSLDGVEGIERALEFAKCLHNGFDWVIDATHPFALLVSKNLCQVCQKQSQPLLRFERTLEASVGSLINSPLDLASKPLQGKRLLLAIGARHLKEAVAASRQGGAEVFARVLPSPESLIKALASDIGEENLAVLRPLKGSTPGSLELALCRRWSIDSIVCRQSGGVTQKLWQDISRDWGLELFLISRPENPFKQEEVNTFEDLLTRIDL